MIILKLIIIISGCGIWCGGRVKATPTAGPVKNRHACRQVICIGLQITGLLEFSICMLLGEGEMLAAANVLSGIIIIYIIMGPPHFFIYIDGIFAIPFVHESNRVIYADDTCLYRDSTNNYNSSDLRFVRDCIKAIKQWSTKKILTLNSSKCKHAYFKKENCNT